LESGSNQSGRQYLSTWLLYLLPWWVLIPASLGLMVAGVSHQLNTPIDAVMLTASTLLDQLAELRTAHQKSMLRRATLERFLNRQALGLGLINDELARAATLVRQFKQVAATAPTRIGKISS
jgi:signal transduction histidine kinase